MVKTKISKKQEVSSTKLSSLKLDKIKGISREKPLDYLKDLNNVGLAIWECLQNNDPEGVMEVLRIHLDAVNKAKLLEKSDLPKSTLYHSLKTKNPTIKTLAKVISTYAHA
jgi:DNA-binding phage protein